jgi:hypothetical protein
VHVDEAGYGVQTDVQYVRFFGTGGKLEGDLVLQASRRREGGLDGEHSAAGKDDGASPGPLLCGSRGCESEDREKKETTHVRDSPSHEGEWIGDRRKKALRTGEGTDDWFGSAVSKRRLATFPVEGNEVPDPLP